jgi:DNA-binding transcriptional MerR regulator
VETAKKGPGLRKLYYSIGEVSELTGIPTHVLRYWESEFAQLRPRKGRTGNRLFQEKDIRIVNQIKELLYDKRYTIAGAKAQFGQKIEVEADPEMSFRDEVRRELQDILEMLNHQNSGRGAAR